MGARFLLKGIPSAALQEKISIGVRTVENSWLG